jgi:FMN-dependent NADH-azoreductase
MSADQTRYNSPLFKRTNYLSQLQKIVGLDELEPVRIEGDYMDDPYDEATTTKKPKQRSGIT